MTACPTDVIDIYNLNDTADIGGLFRVYDLWPTIEEIAEMLKVFYGGVAVCNGTQSVAHHFHYLIADARVRKRIQYVAGYFCNVIRRYGRYAV